MGIPKLAIILAGGKGKRLGLLGQMAPKVLTRIRNKTLLERHCDQLKLLGISDLLLVLSLSHRDRIYSFLKRQPSITRPFKKFRMIFEQHPYGPTLGLIRQLKKVHACALLILGDMYHPCRFDKARLRKLPVSAIGLGVGRQPKKRIIRECNVRVSDAGEILSIREKPGKDEIDGTWCWSGWAVLPSDIHKKIRSLKIKETEIKRMQLGTLIERIRLGGKRTIAIRDAGRFGNINRAGDIHLANRNQRP